MEKWYDPIQSDSFARWNEVKTRRGRQKIKVYMLSRKIPNEQLDIHHQRNDCIKHRICAIWSLNILKEEEKKTLGLNVFSVFVHFLFKWIIIVSQMNWTWSYVRVGVRVFVCNWGWTYIHRGSASEITLRHINDAVSLLNSHFKRKLKSKKRKLSLGIHLYMAEDEKNAYFSVYKRCVVRPYFSTQKPYLWR